MITQREQVIDPHLMKVCVCVRVSDCLLLFQFTSIARMCVCVCVFVCVTERGGTHMCLHVHMCGLVQLPAVYSADIIGMSTQRWVVLISFPSMPFEQHGNHSGE